MATLTPAELQEARIRSGNLGGRPRKPTMSEARDTALAELTPRAVEVLRRELDEGGPQAVRAAMKIIDHAWGTPPQRIELSTPELENVRDLRDLSTEEFINLRRRVLQGALPNVSAPVDAPDDRVLSR